jgi:hypothetical protein
LPTNFFSNTPLTHTQLVSIALCTYEGAAYLPEQLDSLLRQTYCNVEIVAVDDCSTDGTPAILERYARQDARIRVIVNGQNLGFRRNFERALSFCRGELIAPCDQDDIWSAQKLSTLVRVLGDKQLAYCDSTLANERGEPIGPQMSAIVPMTSTDDPLPFAFGNCVSGHAMLFRRALLGLGLPVPEGFFHDWWLATVASASGGTVFHPESLVLYRQHGANVTDRRLGEMMEAAGLHGGRPRLRAQRPRGSRLKDFRETEQRLAAIARLPGPHQLFAEKLHAAWRRREQQWFSPRLAGLMLKHRHRLLRLAALGDKGSRRYSRELLFGVRIKRLTDANGYCER